jgi:hypothetical protein
MVFDFIGAFLTGFGLMGVVMLLNRLTGQRLGGWIYPAIVALGMVGYTVWAEYSWAARTMETQPQLRLASQSGDAVFYRPWTFIWPHVTRITAVDVLETRVHPAQPDLVLTRVVLIARWQPVRAVISVFDCEAGARADLGPEVTLNADGTLEGADWVALESDNAVLVTACTVGEEIRNGRGESS